MSDEVKKDSEPEVCSIVKDEGGFKVTRRNVLSTLGVAAGAAAAAGACATLQKTKRIRQMGPRTWTQPCGTPIPPNAFCVCNCIQTSANFKSNTEQVCTCNTIGGGGGGGWVADTTGIRTEAAR